MITKDSIGEKGRKVTIGIVKANIFAVAFMVAAYMSPSHHVLVVSGYSGSEYAAYKGFINVGDIHSCEPWLYSECLAKNIKVRAKEWRKLTRGKD